MLVVAQLAVGDREIGCQVGVVAEYRDQDLASGDSPAPSSGALQVLYVAHRRGSHQAGRRPA